MNGLELKKPYYPHLLPGETRIWRGFLRLYENEWKSYEYDIHLGDGVIPEETMKTVYGPNFTWLTKKRCDVVGWNGDKATIFEVRSKASLPLIGQLVGYQFLWMRQNTEKAAPRLILVCEQCNADDVAVARAQSISIVKVVALEA